MLVSVPCKNFYTEKGPNYKYITTVSGGGAVSESAKTEAGTRRNVGKVTFSKISGTHEECACGENFFVAANFGVIIEGKVTGTYFYPDEDPETYSNDILWIFSVMFVSPTNPDSDEVELWPTDKCMFAPNVASCPEWQNNVQGLRSSGTLGINFLGKSAIFRYPYNTWGPSWADLENYSGFWNIRANVTVTIEGCD